MADSVFLTNAPELSVSELFSTIPIRDRALTSFFAVYLCAASVGRDLLCISLRNILEQRSFFVYEG